MMILANPKEIDGNTLYYVDINFFTPHQETIYRIWTEKSFLTKKYGHLYLNLPVKNCDIKKCKKDLILKNGDLNLFFVVLESCFNGQCTIDEVICDNPELFFITHYDSKSKSLLISHGALFVLTKSDFVKVKWYKSGRLYGTPSKGNTIFHIDGSIEENIEKVRTNKY